MTYDRTRPACPADVTMTLVASNAIVPAALVAPGAARAGRSADWAVTELYSLHHRGLVRLAVLLVRDIPTAEEAGLSGFHISLWQALWAPRGTPKDLIAKINAAVVDSLADATARSRLAR